MNIENFKYDPVYCGWYRKGVKINGKEAKVFFPPFGITDEQLYKEDKLKK